MEMILENYLVIIIIGLFFVFALIGYLIDMLRQNNKEQEELNIRSVEPIEFNIDVKKNNQIDNDIDKNEEKKNNADELLENYDKELND